MRQTLIVTHTGRFDDIAPAYDETRGDEYAADIARMLPQGPAPYLS
ncbi:MAG: hypothetical protein M0Z47_09825 [Actinomycetota bacterium]|nr:hypothetical protein [Actinomycetota bacterium]